MSGPKRWDPAHRDDASTLWNLRLALLNIADAEENGRGGEYVLGIRDCIQFVEARIERAEQSALRREETP